MSVAQINYILPKIRDCFMCPVSVPPGTGTVLDRVERKCEELGKGLSLQWHGGEKLYTLSKNSSGIEGRSSQTPFWNSLLPWGILIAKMPPFLHSSCILTTCLITLQCLSL